MAGQHNKIINAAAKRILAPEGLFRVDLHEHGLMITGIL